MEKTFVYYAFDGDNDILGLAIIGTGKEDYLTFVTDGLHDSGECLAWLEGLCTGFQIADNKVRDVLGVEPIKYNVEEVFVFDIEDGEKAKKKLNPLGLWTGSMEECLMISYEAKKDREIVKKQRNIAELEDGEQYYYCWGFSGVDHISEDSIKDDVEPDFIHKGTREQAESMAFWKGREDLESYRGLYGVPDEEEVDEEEFTEYANDNVVTFVEEKFAFDKANKNKTWELEF